MTRRRRFDGQTRVAQFEPSSIAPSQTDNRQPNQPRANGGLAFRPAATRETTKNLEGLSRRSVEKERMLNFVVNRAPKEVVYCAFPKYLAEGEWEKFENIFKEKKTVGFGASAPTMDRRRGQNREGSLPCRRSLLGRGQRQGDRDLRGPHTLPARFDRQRELPQREAAEACDAFPVQRKAPNPECLPFCPLRGGSRPRDEAARAVGRLAAAALFCGQLG